MRSAALTDNTHGVAVWRGHRIAIRDDARSVLLIIEMFADADLTPEAKNALLPSMLFRDPEKALVLVATADDYTDLVGTVLWDVCGLDVTGAHCVEWEEPVIDWAEDAGRIKATLLADYGLSWDDIAERISFADLAALLSECDSESPLGRAVHYRTAEPPKRTEHNGDYCDAWQRARKFYALHRNKQAPEDDMSAQSEAVGDLFAAHKLAAQREARRHG